MCRPCASRTDEFTFLDRFVRRNSFRRWLRRRQRRRGVSTDRPSSLPRRTRHRDGRSERRPYTAEPTTAADDCCSYSRADKSTVNDTKTTHTMSDCSDERNSIKTEPKTSYTHFNKKKIFKQLFLKTEVQDINNGHDEVKNNLHLIDHDYFPLDINIDDDKCWLNQHLIDHDYSGIPDINIIEDTKKVDQHLAEHNYCYQEKDISVLGKDVIKKKSNADEPLTYSVLPGVRLNSQVYMDNLHHRYYKHSSRNNVIYLVCENQKNKKVFCPVMASISVDVNDKRIKISGKHNHLPRLVDIPMIYLRRAIGLQGTTSGSTPVRQLYNQEIVSNPEGAKNYSLSQSQLSVRRMRHRRKKKLKNLKAF